MGSLIRRGVAMAPLGVLTALILFVALQSGGTSAASYNPTMSITSSDNAPGAHADITTQFNIPSPDPNFQAVISFTPAAYQIVDCTAQTAAPSCADAVIPDGTATGTISATATLGTLNNPCNTTISVTFNLMDATTNEAVTTVYQDTDADTHGQQFEDDNNDGIPNGAQMYPDYLLRLARTQPFPGGQPLQPMQRFYGQAVVANSDVGINFLTFAPGTTINGQVMDPIIGYPSFTLLNNTGDPQGVYAPNAITDFCTPLSSATKTFGMEGGHAARTNPISDSTQTFVIYTVSQPDADGDGIENALDPCPTQGNSPAWNPRSAVVAGDADGDGLPTQCDPSEAAVTGFNQDQDVDGYKNRGDNCPLVANGESDASNQLDTDQDGIGDTCDPSPSAIDGIETKLCLSADVAIGTGGPASNPTAAPPCGNTPSTGTPTPAPTVSPTAIVSVTPTPSGGVTPTPTQSGGVTPTPGTPTPTATPVPTITPTAVPSSLTQGDFNCDGSLTPADGVVILAALAGGHLHQTAPCQPIGATVGSNKFGDVDCDGNVTAMDALLTIEKAASLTVQHSGNCPDFGAPLV